MLKQYETLELASTTDEPRASFRAPAIGRILPSVVTLMALCCGMSAIELAIVGRYRAAAIAIILAGVFDGLDGRAARLLNSASIFGAELDSLADVVSFGVAPSLLIYHWSVNSFAGFGWASAMFYVACCGMRLARFNTQRHDKPSDDSMHGSFTGVPAPAGAGLVLVPMFVAFASGNRAIASPVLNAAVLAVVAFLMVSRIPTWSLKPFRLSHHHLVPALIAAILVAALLAAAPWWTLATGGVLYAASIPASLVAHRCALVRGRRRSQPGHLPGSPT
jgi:CDP-diacylglycerol---serine O-phosphatidyltransferase